MPAKDQVAKTKFQREVDELSRSIAGAGRLMGEMRNKVRHMKEAIKKVWEHDDMLHGDILKRISKLEKEKADKDDLEKLDKEKADKKKVKEKNKKRKKEIAELRELLKQLESKVKTLAAMGSGDSGISADIIVQLTQRIENIEAIIL